MGRVLSSWKEIASFLGKGVRTVQRWESELQLPVRRPGNGLRHVVFADSDELTAWATRRVVRHDGIKSVLLLEPDRDFRLLLRSCLEDHGYFVFCCANEREAWFVFEEGPAFNLLIFGLQTHGKGDLELPDRVSKRSSKLPIILISPTAPAHRAFAEMRERGWTVLTRPITTSAFMRAVDTALGQKTETDMNPAQARIGTIGSIGEANQGQA